MNCQKIYENFKMTSKHKEETLGSFFCKATEDEIAILSNLYHICVQHNQIWDEKDLWGLQKLSIPPQVLQFYKELSPLTSPINNAGVRLATLKKIKEENTVLTPGAYLVKFGFLVIATTFGGNPLFIDLNEPQAGVYICDYTFLYYDTSSKVLEFSCVAQKLYDVLYQAIGNSADEVNYENIKRLAVKVEDSFEVFMLKLSNNEYGSATEDIETLLE